MNFHDLPLRRRLTLVIMLTSCATLLLAAVSFITNDVIRMRQSTGEDLATLVQIIGSASTAAIVFDDATSAQETLDILQNQPQIMLATIYNQWDESIATYRANNSTSTNKTTRSWWRKHVFWDDYIDMHNQISLDGRIVGSVYMRSDLSKLDDRLSWYLRVVSLVLAVSLFVAFLLSRRLQRIIADPIVRLAETAHQISTERNYALRAESAGHDEVGNLIDGFNEMLSEIQARDNKLEQHRTDLEDRVSRRTEALEIANRDLAQAKENAESAANRLEHQAYHDSLTDLPNRTLLDDRLSVALAHAARENKKLALLFLDLDEFKRINDTLGHAVGDLLLCRVAELLESCVRAEDTVARLGGDEFMILLPGIIQSNDAARVAQKFIDSLKQAISCDGHEIHLTTSIGITVYPDDGLNGNELMRSADSSMYKAKESGRNTYMFYQADMGVASSRRWTLENELRKALDRQQFLVYYHPQVTAATQEIVGVEALVRWQHPELGMVMPDQFIALAEDLGLISEIGEWVLFEACKQTSAWHASGFDNLQIAVNLSPKQFRKQYIEGMVGNVLRDTGLPASCLELEITESLSMQNVDVTIDTLHVLKKMGVQIAVDDFGTGYSSLSYLTKFPIHTLKIDRSFIRDIPQNREDASLARAIIAMAHGLGLRTVAEGIETQQQLYFFRKAECDILQGYLFGKPMPAEEITELLERQAASTVTEVEATDFS